MLDMIEKSCKQFPEGAAPGYNLTQDGVFRARRRDMQEVLRDMISALALCNNVTPVDAGPVKEVNVEEFGN